MGTNDQVNDIVNISDSTSDRNNNKRKYEDMNDIDVRKAKWDHFMDWLAKSRLNRNFDVVIDGANVGYYKQNYSNAPGCIDYKQLNGVMKYVRSIGLSPLLILHCRHVEKQMIPNSEASDIIEEWRNGGYLYATPRSFNDDWFWIYAA